MAAQHSSSVSITPAVLDSLLAHIAIIDHSGVICHTNRSWQSFGKKDVQIKRADVGSNYFEILQQAVEMGNDYALKIFLGIKKVAAGKKDTFSIPYPLYTAESTYWFECTVRPADDQGECVIIHEDISSTVKADQQHELNQDRYQVQFNQSLDGILITDTTGNILDANPAASAILGWSHEEFLKLTRTDIVDVEDPAYHEALEKRKKTGMYKVELSMSHKDKQKSVLRLLLELIEIEKANCGLS